MLLNNNNIGIDQLKIATAVVDREFGEGFFQQMDALDGNFNKFYNNKIEADVILKEFSENQLEALVRYFPLDPTRGQKIRKHVLSNFFTVAK